MQEWAPNELATPIPDNVRDALTRGDLAPLKAYLVAGGDPEAEHEYNTLLELAFDLPRHLLIDAIRLLVAHGVNLDKEATFVGTTALHRAVWKHNHELINYLIDAGAKNDWEGLMEAARGADRDCARLLLQRGARLISNIFVVSDRSTKDAGYTYEDRADVRALLHSVSDVGGGSWKGYVREWRLRVCVLRALCAAGRATPLEAKPHDLLFSRTSATYLPDAIFRLVIAY